MINSYNEYVLACLELLPHEWRYRVMDNALMSDYAYDLKVKEIKDFENKIPLHYHVSFSPTQYIGFVDAKQLKMEYEAE